MGFTNLLHFILYTPRAVRSVNWWMAIIHTSCNIRSTLLVLGMFQYSPDISSLNVLPNFSPSIIQVESLIFRSYHHTSKSIFLHNGRTGFFHASNGKLQQRKLITDASLLIRRIFLIIHAIRAGPVKCEAYFCRVYSCLF